LYLSIKISQISKLFRYKVVFLVYINYKLAVVVWIE